MKKLIFILSILFSLASSGQVIVVGYIKPPDGSLFPTHIDSLGKGGFHAVTTIVQRNAITDLRRRLGMQVFVNDSNKTYKLGAGLTNSDWTVYYDGGLINNKVDTLYRVNDSTVGYTINGRAHTIEILGRLSSGGGGGGGGGSGITSLNTLTNTTQTFAFDQTGTLPGVTSATSTHTFHHPLASGIGVTNGGVSRSDYDRWNLMLPLADTAAMLSNYVRNSRSIFTGYGLTGGGDLSANRTIIADSATLSAYYLRRKDSATGINLNGYLTRTSVLNYIPAQFNPIAGANMTITGTYPNITFTAAGGGGGGGVTTIGTLNGGTASANGASISGSTLYMYLPDTVLGYPGLMTAQDKRRLYDSVDFLFAAKTNYTALGTTRAPRTVIVKGVQISNNGVPIVPVAEGDSLLSWNIIAGVNSDSLNGYWRKTGNAGTTAGTHFVGTTDNVGLQLKTNSVQRIDITNAGQIGIGVSGSAETKLLLFGQGSTSATYASIWRNSNGQNLFYVDDAGNGFLGNATTQTTTNTLYGTNKMPNMAAGAGTREVRINPATGTLTYADTLSGGLYWGLTGNAGTTALTNFIGTTDNKPLTFKVNNTFAGWIGVPGYERTTLGYNSGNGTAFGYNVFNETNDGQMIGFGSRVFQNQTSAAEKNAAFGMYMRNIIGDQITAFGIHTLETNYSGTNSSAFGNNTLRWNIAGINNTAVGTGAGYLNTTYVSSITPGAGGSGYTTATVTIAAPITSVIPGVPSVTATATAIISSGQVVGYTITNNGNNYGSAGTAPTVTITGDGTGATATAVLASGDRNTFLGTSAGTFSELGSDLVHIGFQSGYGAGSNEAGYNDQKISSLGAYSSRHSAIARTTAITNATAIGYNAKYALSNTLILGDSVLGTITGIGTSFPDSMLTVQKGIWGKRGIRFSGLAASANATDSMMVVNASNGNVGYRAIPSGGGGSGTVTSVSFTGGLISVATATSTPALTVSGTSGGIPYFSSSSTWASSAALAANALVIGGGAGTAPSTTATGTGILTFLGTPSSANLASAVTDETGSGALVFATSPTFVTPLLGTPTSGVLTNTTGYKLDKIAASGASNSINNGDNEQNWSWNTLGTSGQYGLRLQSTSTASTGNPNARLFYSLMSGANSNSGQSTTTIMAENQHSGTTSTNYGVYSSAVNATTGIAGYFTATSNTNNYALIVPSGGGSVGIGNSAPTEKLDVTGNVRFSGALMPNNTAGTSGQYLTSAGAGTVPTWTTPTTLSYGNYTPSTTLTTNLAAATAYVTNYYRVGDMVTVFGKISVDPTAIGACVLTINVPVSSGMTGTGIDAGGTAASPTITGEAISISSGGSGEILFKWVATDISNHDLFFTFSYKITAP